MIGFLAHGLRIRKKLVGLLGNHSVRNICFIIVRGTGFFCLSYDRPR
jgi:hypothetical protein